MRLSPSTIEQLPEQIVLPGYDRDKHTIGIVHFGIGAFHRAHMAVYTDDVLAAEGGDWRILGVSLRSGTVRDQMSPQGGLYSLVERSAQASKVRIIGAVADVLVASEERERVVNALASAGTHIVSFTITEKGYCRAPDGSLDFALADSRSAYSYLAESFARRRDSGLAGLTLLSCDNLAANGAQLQRLMAQYLEATAPDVRAWFDENCACPLTMIDRIVPATTQTDRAEVEALLGVQDAAAVVTEPFTQWVIEDKFAGPRPAWEKHGAQITSNVSAFETAKLRMLNGAHSALAYLGLQRGHEFVHEAVADAELVALINRLMRDEAAPSLVPADGQDLSKYADALITRFKNPALNHKLIQIAMDGSQKIPQRWLETLAYHQQAGKQCPAILEALAAWIMHIRGDKHDVDDPMRDDFQELWKSEGRAGISRALFSGKGTFAAVWQGTSDDIATLNSRLN
ncbi:mannitol dehydrogenase family protein [Sphingorhabdus lacus]|jgi:fructuronate reductase|uniref:mannitol dehydrogenase family protein n=1 Tax=Sphingorhabdus lacus TaxID=392610 RepID=UPI0035947D47